jgi:transposase-like protein
MAKRGRPAKGAELVNAVPGSEASQASQASQVARQRLQVVLQTLTGALSVQEACLILGIGRSGFHKLRQQFLQQAMGLLEPRPRGRRPRQPSEAELEVQRLKHQIVQLKLDLKATQIREEIALVMPHLLKDKRAGHRPAGEGKKTPGRTRRTRPSATRGGSTGSVR